MRKIVDTILPTTMVGSYPRPGWCTYQLLGRDVREAFKQGGLAGSGVIVVNAPWKLDEELAPILPALADRLGLGSWGEGRVEWLVM